MLRILVLLALLVAPIAARAESAADFRTIITAQIDAFRADDGARAYGYAAPVIKNIFPTPDAFMAMVRKGYPPVYRPQSFRFGDVTTDPLGRPAQRVILTGADGKTYEALYTFQRQPDGSWKIDSCRLLEIPGLDA